MTHPRLSAITICSLLLSATATGQKSVSISCGEDFLSAVATKTYDGTSRIAEATRQYIATKKIAPTIDGIDQDDDVTVWFDGYYADEQGLEAQDVASVTQLFLTLSLEGADAYKYSVASGATLNMPANVKPLNLTSDTGSPIAQELLQAFYTFEFQDTELRREIRPLKKGGGVFKLRDEKLLIYTNADEGLAVYATQGYIPSFETLGKAKMHKI